MIVAHCMYRCYFYLSNDINRSLMHEKLESLGFQKSNYGTGNIAEPKRFWEMQQDKLSILVMQVISDVLALEDMPAVIGAVEGNNWINEDDLVGICDIFASSLLAPDELLTRIETRSKLKIEYHFDIEQSHLVRFYPTKGYSCYACRFVSLDRTLTRLLGFSLPLIEARHIETDMISNLLRERMAIIEQETTEIDKKLSQVLHSNLVSTGSLLTQVEELEGQIQELAYSYGIIAGHNNTVNEGYRRLEDLIYKLKLQLEKSKLDFANGLIDAVCQPFTKRLQALAGLQRWLENSRASHQAAIDVVGSKIDIINSRTNIRTQVEIKELMEVNTAIQKQSIVFQFAAGLIEFIVLAYYSHSLWKNLAQTAYAMTPAALQLIFVLLFSGLTTYLTHMIAEYLQGEQHLKRKILLTSIPLLIIIIIVLWVSFL